MNTQTFPQYINDESISDFVCDLMFADFFSVANTMSMECILYIFSASRYKFTQLQKPTHQHIVARLVVCARVVYHFILSLSKSFIRVYLHFNLLQSDSIIIYTDSLALTRIHSYNGGCARKVMIAESRLRLRSRWVSLMVVILFFFSSKRAEKKQQIISVNRLTV